MYYRKPHYYQDFVCTADKCPDTCCAGWQIFIDEESLETYSRVKGDFGIRLLNSIDWSVGAFEQYEKRCSFLNEKNLCDIYRAPPHCAKPAGSIQGTQRNLKTCGSCPCLFPVLWQQK